jgi:hypothetical protein
MNLSPAIALGGSSGDPQGCRLSGVCHGFLEQPSNPLELYIPDKEKKKFRVFVKSVIKEINVFYITNLP